MIGAKPNVGDRLRLTAPMRNQEWSVVPEEELPVGSEGTVTCVGQWLDEWTQWIGVDWDNGSVLNVLAHRDSYEIMPGGAVDPTPTGFIDISNLRREGW